MHSLPHHTRPCVLRRAVLAACALLGAGAALAQAAEDPGFTEQARPSPSVEAGIRMASRDSAKANEYSGWTRRAPHLFGNVQLQGGGAFDSEDALRWQLQGLRLGSRAAEVDAQIGIQGQFRLGLSWDELRRELSDSYRSPYLGVGGSTLGLPGNWVVPVVPRVSTTAPNARGLAPEVTSSAAVVNGLLTAPTAAQAAQAAAMQAADLPAFAPVDLFTQRSRFGLAWDQQIGPRWSWRATLAHEHKNGIKPQGGMSRAVGGDTASILPAPVNQSDDTFSLQLAYSGEALHTQGGVEGSAFNNHVPSLTWTLWPAPNLRATLANEPSNRFYKLWWTGSWKASEASTWQAHASRSRATQNEALLADSTAPWVPVGTADARVQNTSAGLKLLHRASAQLALSGGYKFDERDNRTPVNTFGYYDNNNPANGSSPFAYLFPSLSGLGQNFNINANLPYSRRSHQLQADAGYALGHGQHVRLSYEGQRIERWCNGSWISCADATTSTEHSLAADWRGTLGEDWNAQLHATTAQRRVDYNELAFLAGVPMANQSPSTATGSLAGSTAYSALQALGLSGYGPVSGLNPAAPAGSLLAFYFPLNNVLANALYGNGNRISEPIGMRRYNQADRDRSQLRGSAQWQPSERFSLQAALQAQLDDYTRSVYGLQRVSGWSAQLDGSYSLGDNLSLGAFGAFEDQRTRSAGNSYTANSAATNVNGATALSGGCFATIAARNANNKIDPCLDWQSTTVDRSSLLGITARRSALFGGKLDLNGSATYSEGRSRTTAVGGSYVNNPFAGVAGAANRDIAAYFVPAEALPLTLVKSLELRLGSDWHLAPRNLLRLAYGYQRLSSSDWRFEAMQPGVLTQVLPTYEQAPRYTVHSLGLSFATRF